MQKRIYINGQRLELNIWDTAGQERYHALSPIYYRDANGALVVFDLTDQDSFLRCKRWVLELCSIVGPSLPIVVVGNKMDLELEKVVEKEQIDTFLESIQTVKYVETSAKSGKGIDAAFLSLAQLALKSSSQNSQDSPSDNHEQQPNMEQSSQSSMPRKRPQSSGGFLSAGSRKSLNRRSLVVLDENSPPLPHVTNENISTEHLQRTERRKCCIIA